jgi:hypothetical protein
MAKKYYNGYLILEHGCCDTSTLIEIKPESKELFDETLKKMCKHYEYNLTPDKLLKLGNEKLDDVSTENIIDALAIAVTLDRERIYSKNTDKKLYNISSKLFSNFNPLVNQYIIEKIPGPYINNNN